MISALPVFTYHPDPVATGSVVASDATCECCDRRRGFTYAGPVYAVEDVGALCPWCIADGRAAERFAAQFTDAFPDHHVPAEVLDEITSRTPGFSGWQQTCRLFHCGDGALYLGPVGADALAAHPDAVESIRADFSWRSEELDPLLAALDEHGSPTAHLFRCRSCGTHLAYADFT